MAKADKDKADKLAAALVASTPRLPPIPPEDFLSSGCTLVNLAVSGHPGRSVAKGHYLYVVGDSSSGKSWLCLNYLAEAARNKHFDGYRFIFDNAENGVLMDTSKYFGAAVADRMEPPRADADGTAVNSATVQEFYYNLELAVRAGPCIYILDSMDALHDDADEDKFEAELKRYDTGKGEVPGSMGMAKAKTNSANISRVVQTLRTNGSILIVLSQTRDKVGGHIPGQKTRGGGRALRFYAHVELWTSVRAPIKKEYLGKEREIGATIKVDVQKNRVSGWEGAVEISFLKGYGIDDLGTICKYLIDEKHWGCSAGVVDAPEFGFKGRVEKLIKHIQDSNSEWELSQLAGSVWRAVIDGARPERKPRYT